MKTARYLVVVWLAAGWGGLEAAPEKEAEKVEVAEAGATVEAAEREIAALGEPLAVLSVDMYRDGGTISFTVGDAAGKKITGCMDGRMSSATVGRLFMFAPHPSQTGALILPTGSQAETALLNVLKKAVGNQPADSPLVAEDIGRLNQIIAAAEARRAKAAEFAGKRPLTADEAVAIAREGLEALSTLLDLNGKPLVHDKGDHFEVVFFDLPNLPAVEGAVGVGGVVTVAKESRSLFGFVDRYVPGEK